jgi:hypothetical protein
MLANNSLIELYYYNSFSYSYIVFFKLGSVHVFLAYNTHKLLTSFNASLIDATKIYKGPHIQFWFC